MAILFPCLLFAQKGNYKTARNMLIAKALFMVPLAEKIPFILVFSLLLHFYAKIGSKILL